MTRPNIKRSKKPDKKQLRKKQAIIVERCVHALNNNADIFRFKVSNPQPPSASANKPQSNGALQHFKPIRIETTDKSALTEATSMLESKFTLKEPAEQEKKKN